MSTGHNRQVYRYIRSIEGSLRKLENLFRQIEAQNPEPRAQDARGELLEQVHVAGAIEQRQLYQLLDLRKINHTWIGSQVAAEFLDMWHAADGRTFYRVTELAIRTLRLGQLSTPAADYNSDAIEADDRRSEQTSAQDS
jgi:hypothetical protein